MNERRKTAHEVESEVDAGLTRNIAAQKVIRHLRAYGPNARVLLLADSQAEIRTTMLEGEFGLFTLYGNEFPSLSPHLAQFNHELGGQVIQVAQDEGKPLITQHVFTLIWAESPGKMSETLAKLCELARKQLRTNEFLVSSGGFLQ